MIQSSANGEFLISVIVPVYNVEMYLTECVESIQQQTYKNLEIILIDDGSTDGSGIMCDSFSSTDHRVKVIHKENGGLVSAWQCGTKAASSEYIIYVDSDDWIERDHIRVLAQALKACDSDIVSIPLHVLGEGKDYFVKGRVECGHYDQEEIRKYIFPQLLHAEDFSQMGIPWSRSGKLIRKKLIMDNLIYSYEKATFEEDLNIMFPVFQDAKAISIIDAEDGYYCYRLRHGSMIHSYNKEMYHNINEIYRRLFECIDDKSNKNVFQIQLHEEYMHAIARAVVNELNNPKGIWKAALVCDKWKNNPLIIDSMKIIDRGKYTLPFRLVISSIFFNKAIKHPFFFWVKMVKCLLRAV
jgi:glycosyltransferases involved in cell wall biogenesis